MIRPTRRPRRGRSGLVSCLAVLLTVLGMVGGVVLPFSAAPAAGEVTDGEVTVDLTQITPAVTRPGDDIVIEGVLGNGTEQALASPRVQLVLQKHVPASRAALDSWFNGENSFNSAILTVEYLDDVPAGEEVPFTITLPADRSPFDGALWGPRGIEVRAVAEGTVAAERTALLWYPGEPQVSAPTELSVLVPFTPTAQEWSASVAEDRPVAEVAAERLGPVLEEMPDGVGWGIDAALLENLPAENGEQDDPADTAETTETEDEPATEATEDESTDAETGAPTTTEETTSPETGATGTAGSSEPSPDETTTSTDPAGETNEATPSDADPDVPDSTGDPTLTDQLLDGAAQRDVLALGYADADHAVLTGPSGAELLQAGRDRTAELLATNGITALQDVAWPASADLASVTALAQTNTRAVVLPADAMPTAVPLNYTPSGRSLISTEAGDVQAMLWDGPLSETFTAELSDLQIRQSVLAQTAVIAREQPANPRGLLATLSRDVGTDPHVMAALSESITALESAPWVELSNLRSLLGRADAGEARASLPAPSPTAHLDAATVARLAQAWQAADAFADVTDEPARFRDEIAPQVLTGVSSTLTNATATRNQVVDEAFAAVEHLSTRIGVEPASEVLLVSTSGEIPITLESTLSVGATVVVRLVPQDPYLRADETVTAHIPPGEATTVRLPVTAVANGNVDVSAEVLTPADGNVLVTADSFQVRVRADWENIGTIVVAALLVLGLAVGLIRTIRKGQRRFTPATPAARAAAAHEETPDGGRRPDRDAHPGEALPEQTDDSDRPPATDETDGDTPPSGPDGRT
ncbi:DUF6049 family protein [Ruania alba]|uniref:Uncharacterized protein n=1 Tax=Ruania alba TaxID=648782 RepID=A0A1H5LHC0_9MICO|nr:DUF6049 family protein [Ruania alba]SEE76463.1 hypothetical protein SAMN04488554_2814 [Ruania alba]